MLSERRYETAIVAAREISNAVKHRLGANNGILRHGFILLCLILSNFKYHFYSSLSLLSPSRATVKNSATIYPAPSSTKEKDYGEFPILVFLVGTALSTSDYASVFKPLTDSKDIIVYVLDTNPGSIAKTLDGFKKTVNNIRTDIQSYYNIGHTSDSIYLGGHSVGGIVALNAFFPANANPKVLQNADLTTNSIPSLPVKGFISFDAVDGENLVSLNYPATTKFDPEKNSRYLTATGQVNPFPILIFASNVTNTDIKPAYGGQRAFKTIASRNNNPTNKYLFVSAEKYHHMDYVDPNAKLIYLLPAYKTDVTRDWSVQTQIKFVAGFQEFVRSKIASFILESRFNTAGFEDVVLVSA